MTADFAKAAMIGEKLGEDDAPDYLSISFSGVDATNHFFGPSSLESEEMVRALDTTLADFMAFTDKTVGETNVVYVLSADHGMPEAVEFMAEQGHPVARNYNADLQVDLNEKIEETFGIDKAIRAFFRPYIYLDHEKISASGGDTRAIERVIVDTLNARPGIAIAIAMPKVPFEEQRDDFLEGPIRRNFHSQRSGDIYVAQSAYSYLMDKGPIAVMHGSPWRYDTHVPVIFSGPDTTPAIVARHVGTVDVAVTLAAMFGTTIPSGASEHVLEEVLAGH